MGARDGAIRYSFEPYGAFGGGARVASGDVNGDGVPDIITAAGTTGGPHIKVFDGAVLADEAGGIPRFLETPTNSTIPDSVIAEFFAYSANFTGGVFVASGDVDGDGRDDIITAAGAGGGPHVKVFSGQDLAVLHDFLAFDISFTGGIHVAAGNVAGDARDEIIVGSGAGMQATVRVYGHDATTFAKLGNDLHPYATFTGGAYVAAGDTDGDGYADLITGPGFGGNPHVMAFRHRDHHNLAHFLAYDNFNGGVRVASGDTTGDAVAEIITVPGPTGGVDMRVFNPHTLAATHIYYDGSFTSGSFMDAGSSTARSHIKIIDNAVTGVTEPGFAKSSGWTDYGTGGFSRDLVFAPAGTGSSTASWTFTDLADGYYRVSTTWAEHDNRATNVPYRINGGPTIAVNQELAPGDFTDAGVGWKVLDLAVEVTDGTLTVQLSDDANGFVIADAVRIELMEPTNVAPVINQVSGTYLAAVGHEFNFPVTVQNGENVFYSLVNPPEGASIDPATGVVTYTPPVAAAGGTTNITVKASDGGHPSMSDSESFSIKVGDFKVAEGETLVFRPTVDGIDPSTSYSYVYEVLPSGIVPSGDDWKYFDGGIIVYSPSEADNASSDTIKLRVKAIEHGTGNTLGTHIFTILVAERNRRPLISEPYHAFAWEAVSFDGTTSEHIVSLNPSIEDFDSPIQSLILSVDSLGTTYDPVIDSFGVITWRLHEDDAVAIYELTVKVSDAFSPDEGENTLIFYVSVEDSRVAPPSPVAIPEFRSGPHGQPMQDIYGVMGNDLTLSNAGTTTVVKTADPIHGTLVLDAQTGQYTYTPDDPLFVGDDSFTYKLEHTTTFNGVPTTVYSNEVEVRLVLTNQAPVAQHDAYMVTEDGVLNVSASLGVRANDSDAEGDSFTVMEVLATAHGQLSLSADGSFSYTPNPDFSGVDSFAYRVVDGLPRLEGVFFEPSSVSDRTQYGIVTITVNAVNDPPQAVDDEYAVVEGELLSIDPTGVLGNDTDPENGSLFVVSNDAVSSNGAIVTVNSNGSFSYDPRGVPALSNLPSGTSVVDSFSYTINDGYVTDTATVYVTVHATPNSAPQAVNDAYAYSIFVSESLVIAAAGVLVNDTDADQDPLTAILVTNATNGTVSLAADGSFTYTRNPGFFGQDSFTYKANDGEDDSNVATVVIDVIGMYDPQTNDPDVPLGGTCNCGCGCGTSAKPDKQTGGLKVDASVGDDPLVYLTNANPHPVIAVETVFSASNTLVPDAVEASLTFGGVVGQTVFYSTAGLSAGDALRFPLQVDATSLPTGRYEYAFTLTNTYGTHRVSQTFSGFQTVVNLTQSEFGNRWSLAGLDRLVVQSGSGGALLVGGNGTALWYQGLGSGQFAASAGDRGGQLTQPIGQFHTAQGNTTVFAYNNWDLLETETNELDDSRHYAYDPETGNLSQVTDRNGRVTEFQYDFQHRLTSEVWRDFVGGPAVRTTTYVYDWADQLEFVVSTAGGVVDSAYEYDYDDMGRVESITNAGTLGSPTVEFAQQYDKLSRRTGLSATIDNVADFVNAYQYDGLSRLTQVTQTGQSGGNAVADKRVDFAYNLGGQFTVITRYADVLANELVAASHFGYEAGTQRLIGLKHSTTSAATFTAATGNLANYTWTYDVLGRVGTFYSEKDADTATYTYDRTSQLTDVGHTNGTIDVEDYGYDLTGNRTDGDYETPAGNNNRLTTDGTYNYSYDDEGNLTARTELVDGQPTGPTTDYAWDHRNRLTSVTFRPSPGGMMSKRVVYTYDVFDRRIGKQEDDNGDTTFDRSERFVYDGPEGGAGVHRSGRRRRHS